GRVFKEQETWILDPLPMIELVVQDVRCGLSQGVIATRFHNGVVSLLEEAVRQVSGETGLRRVAISGGVFQNAYLFEHVVRSLTAGGLEVFSHVEVPANDACIALGQAYVAAHWLTKTNQP
ncbi:MAG TPA: hypothetical protein PKV86_16105, partial [Syntrophobacteraceae bacterium]|nr:hypothetical protein [Syntrophobacteraceae bacterium]